NRTQVYDLIQNGPPPGRLRLTASVDFVIGTNVDTPSGQACGQTSVLSFFADRQRQLEVRHHDPGGLAIRIGNRHVLDLGRRQRIGNEHRRIVTIIYDIDFLAAQLVHDVTHSLAHGADTRTLGVHAGQIRSDRDFAAVPGFAGDPHD